MASQTWEDYLRGRNVNTNADSSNQSAAQQQLQQPAPSALGDIANLYTLYNGGNAMNSAYGQSADAAQAQAQAMQQQMQNMPTLDKMYGQDSSYAQAMRQKLAAADAKAGRNSQYGDREVQLQAALADKGSQYAAQQASMANQYSQAQSAANTARTNATLGQQQIQAQQLSGLFGLANKSGITDKAVNGLQDLYNQYFPSQSNAGPMANTSQQSMQDRQGYDIPWAGDTGQTNPMISYQSNGGMGQMYGPSDSNYTSGMDYSQAPTSSDNSYYQPDWNN